MWGTEDEQGHQNVKYWDGQLVVMVKKWHLFIQASRTSPFFSTQMTGPQNAHTVCIDIILKLHFFEDIYIYIFVCVPFTCI